MGKSKQNEQEKPWSICDDFLDPLAEYLEDFTFDDTKFYSAVMKDGVSALRFEGYFLLCFRDMDFAMLWIQVHKSVALADRVREKIKELMTAVKTQTLKKLQAEVSGLRKREPSPKNDRRIVFSVGLTSKSLKQDKLHEVATYRRYFQYLSVLLRGDVILKQDIRRDFLGPFKATDLYQSKTGKGKLGISKSQFYRLAKDPDLIEKTPNGYRVRRELLPESPMESR